MPAAANPFDCVLITRPQPEANQLSSSLAAEGLSVVVQPAHEFRQVDISASEFKALAEAAATSPAPLLVFTSPRAVRFALPQLPLELVRACQLAAIGSATRKALEAAGLSEVLQPESGYRSEDLLHTLDSTGPHAKQAWIVAAGGGRQALLDGLSERGLDARMLLVYQRLPAVMDESNEQRLQNSHRILSVWTSADAMQQLSQMLSPTAWQRVCAGEWLVISQRLARQAETFHAAVVHESSGPGNEALAAAITEIRDGA